MDDCCKQPCNDHGCGSELCIDASINNGRKFPSVACQKSIRFKKFRVFSGPSSPMKSDEDCGKMKVQQPTLLCSNVCSDEILYVFIDLETTGFSPDSCDILQISAMTNSTETINDFFDIYLLPTKPIHPKVTDLTNLRWKRGSLYMGEDKVSAVPKKTGLKHFLNYLRTLEARIVVVAHKIDFDLGFLYKHLRENGLWKEFKSLVFGAVDTIPVFRHCYPNLTEYKLGALWLHFTGDLFSAHNALEDVKVLRSLSALIVQKFSNFTNDLALYER